MGLTLSCPGGGYDSLDESLDALLQSLSLGNDSVKSSLRSVSFNGRDSQPVLKVWGSGKLIVKGSLSFNKSENSPPFHCETKFSAKNTTTQKEHSEKSSSYKCTRFAPLPAKISESVGSPKHEAKISESIGSPKHEAAVKLQKVYKSFRTRRQLADCAVLVEQRWWKLLDFAMLKRSSVSFFHVEKTESVVSKWARAKSRAAKVGKGLSKDEKARKLALQHWLEAIDPRHRYGHNLHFYYDRWLRCESKQPFFYWLDVGDGKEVSLDEKCPRTKLQYQCIRYLGPKEREVYEVVIEDGKLLYKKSGTLLDTTEDSTDSKWIFVLSTSKILYVGLKKKGTFQHSSFLAGGATSAAGRLEVQNGILKAIWPHSGHYRPTDENFQEFIAYLQSKNVDLTDVKKSPIEEDEEPCNKLRTIRSVLNLARIPSEESEEQNSNGLQTKSHKRSQSCDASLDLEETESKRMKKIVIDDSEDSEDSEDEDGKPNTQSEPPTMFRKENLFVEEREGEEPKVPSELILRRMKFRKETLSLQLGKQLSCKWTTGAGPRIGCVRDFPSELQIQALEQVNLSPKTGAGYRSWPSPGNLPTPIQRASRCS